jgi:hypothetical protein
MVRWLMILLMAVLPLHAWAGATLSVARAPGHAPAAVHATSMPHGSSTADPGAVDADCLEHATATHHHAVDQGGDDAGACPTCPACHACSPAALLSALPGAAAPGFGAPRPDGAPTRFASAEPAPGFKPPIS